MPIKRDSGLCAAPEAEVLHELVRLHARTGLSYGELERARPELLAELLEAGVRAEQVRALLAS